MVYAGNSNPNLGGYFKIFFIIADINNLDAKFQGYFMYFFIKVRLFVIFLENRINPMVITSYNGRSQHQIKRQDISDCCSFFRPYLVGHSWILAPC
jgi:hypothetical protein